MKTDEENMEQIICFYEETNFKNTEIGEVPADWEVVKLGEVAEIIMGQSPPGSSYNTSGNGVPFLQGKAEFGSISPKHIKYTTMPLKIAKRGTILLSVRAPVGDVNLADKEYCIGRGLASISIKRGNNNYLFYILRYLRDYIESESYGSTFKAISKPALVGVLIPLPPLEEQKAIAYVLSAVQDAREKTEKVINATKQLKKALMKHLFTYGPVSLEEADRVNLKETEIGPISEDWEVVKLGEVTRTVKGSKPETLSEVWSKDSVPYLTAEYLRTGNYKYFVPKASAANMVEVADEDIVLIWDGSKAGDVFTGAEGILASTMVKIIPVRNDLLNLYLFYFLKTRFEMFNTKTTGTTIPHVSKTLFKELPIPLPPLAVQQRIAEILQAVDEKIQAEEKKKQALDNLFNSMLHMLMSGKLRVKFRTVEEEGSG